MDDLLKEMKKYFLINFQIFLFLFRHQLVNHLKQDEKQVEHRTQENVIFLNNNIQIVNKQNLMIQKHQVNHEHQLDLIEKLPQLVLLMNQNLLRKIHVFFVVKKMKILYVMVLNNIIGLIVQC